ncbi:MAG TPA: glycosyltransferase [Niabella sp.]
MSDNRQIFQTENRTRWVTFKWFSRFLILLIILSVLVFVLSLIWMKKPAFPGLSKAEYTRQKNPVIPKDLSERDKKRYKGFQEFLKAKKQNNLLVTNEKKRRTSNIRAAFFVDWDPQASSSLFNHIDKLNMVIPEWCTIDPDADTLVAHIAPEALAYMRKYKVAIVPILSNVNTKFTSGDFDGKLLERVLSNPQKRERLLNDVAKFLETNKFQGINLDFEELTESSIPLMENFQKALYEKLHPKGMLITQDILPNDADYNVTKLAPYVDYYFLMAYDQHYNTSVPGPVSAQDWIEKVLDQAAKNIPSEKIILCMATYGYDWPEESDGSTITYQEALSLADQYKAEIDFYNNNYNCTFKYTDFNGIKHTVYFNDAASNFNTMRFADSYGLGGVSIWRLGAEDERLWTFYNLDLTDNAVLAHPTIYDRLRHVNPGNEKPDYIGEGEVLDVVSEPNPGIIDITIDSTEHLVAEEEYKSLPTQYVIKKFGQVHNQVLLTFDDGPDPLYTPQIINILKQEKVPAAFFMIGVNAEANLSIVREMGKDTLFEIGNHTFTHPNIAAVSVQRALNEMDATRLIIEAATHHSTILFRAPFNADSEPTKYEELRPVGLSKKQGYYTVGESIDPNDWDTDNPANPLNADSIVNRVIREYEQNPEKGIILLHDAGGPREATVKALPRIIHYFKSKGIQFISVGQLLNLTRDQVMPPVKSDIIQADSWVARAFFYISKFLAAVFWLAVFLGIGRIVFMGILATLNYRKEKKEQLSPLGSITDKVSIIVPAYNEAVNAVATVKSLLGQDYPNYEVIFVDDGSTDDTYQKVAAAFAGNGQVKVLTKPNGGKASALNFGINGSDSRYIVCIDADTQLKKDAISQMMRFFTDPEVGAVAGNVKVGNTNTILTKWQSIEYITAQNFDRRAFDYINGITVVPGAIGAFRKQAMIDAGGFTYDSLAEDCDLTIRILRKGYVIRNCNEAIALTEAPETVKQFLKQRFRWSYGIMQSFWKNRDACFRRRYKGLGMVSLPNILIFQIILPLIAPLADLLFFISIFYNHNDPKSEHQILFYYGLFLVVDFIVAAMAFRFEKQKSYWPLLWLLPQRFVYRQLMYVVLFRSIRRAIKGEGQGWGSLKRTGNVVLKEQ